MRENRTSNLNHILKNATQDNFKDYLEKSTLAPSLKDYFSEYMANNHLKPGEIIQNSLLSRSYGYSILNGNKIHPSRDCLISLCLGAQMNLDEVQHALRIAKLGELYAKVPRDAAIMICINQKEWNLVKINSFLYQENLEPIHNS